jgi:hypothetical protein
VWIVLATLGLAVLNYRVLINKLHFIIDLSFLFVLGTCSAPMALTSSDDIYMKPLLDSFFIMLMFLTIRIINRQELRAFMARRILTMEWRLIAASLAFVLILWTGVALGPGPLPVPGYSYQASNLKNLGTAMEMYSTDNAGYYPASLGAVSPDYLKKLPSPLSEGSPKSQAYYKAKYGISTEYAYEVNNADFNYTIYCVYSSGTMIRRLRYSGKTGLENDIR